MPFGIVALFDESTEAGIRALRMQLAEAGYGDRESADVRPHLTLAILPALDPESLRQSLRAWCLDTPPLALEIASAGSFPTAEGVVYLAPVVTMRLLEMHAQVDHLLLEAGLQGMQPYRPGFWVPHVTVGYQLGADALRGAIGLVREADVFYTGVLTQVAVCEFPPLEVLYAFPLRGEAGARGTLV